MNDFDLMGRTVTEWIGKTPDARPRQGTPHAPQARGPVAPEPAPAQGPRLPQALREGLHMSEWLHLFMTDADTFLFSIFVGTMMFSAVVVSLR